MQKIATWTNILYIKLPVFDPDKILTHMLRYLWWIFTPWFFAATLLLMILPVMWPPAENSALEIVYRQEFYFAGETNTSFPAAIAAMTPPNASRKAD